MTNSRPLSPVCPPSSNENEDTDISTSSDIILCNSHLDDKTTSSRAISPVNLKNQLSSMEDDVSTSSSDIIFCNTSSKQPESTSVTVNSGATIKILTVTTRDRCLDELSNPNTFLSDITINAFAVS